MAILAEVKVNLDLEPNERAKEFIRDVVIQTLKEVLTDPTWLEAHIDQTVEEVISRRAGLTFQSPFAGVNFEGVNIEQAAQTLLRYGKVR